MRINLSLLAIILLSLAAGYYWPGQAGESSYPAPKVNIYVPAKPGGTTDATARAFARSLERNTGVKAVVINQTAGGGTVAVSSVANARSDGSSLLLFHAMLHVSKRLGRMNVGAEGLTPLATISRASDVYVARSDAPFDSLASLFEYARSRELTVASQMGGTTQLKASALATTAAERGAKLRPVAIGSMAKRVTALLGEQVDLSIVDLRTARQYLDAGSMKPLAVIGSERDPFEPDWPTASEQGVPIELSQVSEVYGPPAMPAEVRARIDALLGPVIRDQELARNLGLSRQSVEYRDANDTAEFIRAEDARVRSLLDLAR